jgi:hypothetical protein
MRNTAKALLWAAALCAAPLGSLLAQAADLPGAILPNTDTPPNRQGTRGANFLEIGVGGRENALAGAAGSLSEGPSAWYWNPAGAVGVEGFSITASRQNLYPALDIAHNYVGVAIPFLGGVAGVSFTSLNSGDIERTTVDDPFGDPTVGTTFEWTSTEVGVGYARRLTDRLELGGQVKAISEGLSDARSSWIGLDLGTRFRTGLYGLAIGAAVQNVGPNSRMRGQLVNRNVNTDRFNNQNTDVQLRTKDTELPTMFRFSVESDLFGRASSLFGSGSKNNSLRGEVAFNQAIDTDVQAALGVEYAFANKVFLRGGKRFFNDGRSTGSNAQYGLSGGGGLRLPVGERYLQFDYAYTSLGDLENIQVFTFSFGR